jgi:hypothetical protein
MWKVLRPFRYRGVRYNPGDVVPAERWTIRKALATTRKITFEADVPPSPKPFDPSKAKRDELESHALLLGIESPDDREKYPNRQSLIDTIKSKTAVPTESSGPEFVEPEDEVPEDEVPEDEVDPFADLEDEDEKA